MDYLMVDNKGDNTLRNILKQHIKKDAKVAVASHYFSIYAFEALQKELQKVDHFQF